MDKNNKNPNVPNLRFPEFTKDWEKRNFRDFTYAAGKRNKDNLPLEPYAITNDKGFIPQKDAHDDFGYMKDTDRSAYMVVKPNSFAYNPARINVGSIGYYDGDDNVIVSSLYEVFQTIEDVNDRFLWYWLKSPALLRWIEKLQEGSVRLYFYYDKMQECTLKIPSLEEQIKVSTLLNKIQERIDTQNKIIEEYLLLKNSIIHQTFSMNYAKVKLDNLLTEVSIRNKERQINTVLSVSNKLGFIKQSEQFEDREVASDDTSNYKIVNKGDYAYNPARINVGSIARLINYDKGIISPMYSCFKINQDKVTYTYFEMFLNSSSFKRQLNKKLEGSVRQCLTFEGMLSMNIELPSIEIQKSISKKIDMLENKLTLETNYLNSLIKQKHFLLNNLFI